jgi:hypothetical protein
MGKACHVFPQVPTPRKKPPSADDDEATVNAALMRLLGMSGGAPLDLLQRLVDAGSVVAPVLKNVTNVAPTAINSGTVLGAAMSKPKRQVPNADRTLRPRAVQPSVSAGFAAVLAELKG